MPERANGPQLGDLVARLTTALEAVEERNADRDQANATQRMIAVTTDVKRLIDEMDGMIDLRRQHDILWERYEVQKRESLPKSANGNGTYRRFIALIGLCGVAIGAAANIIIELIRGAFHAKGP